MIFSLRILSLMYTTLSYFISDLLISNAIYCVDGRTRTSDQWIMSQLTMAKKPIGKSLEITFL